MGKVHQGAKMITFKEFMDGQQPEDEDSLQDDDLIALKKLIDDFNEFAPQKDNMMSVVENKEGEESYTLFIGPDEMGTGSPPELIAQVKQIRQEHGF